MASPAEEAKNRSHRGARKAVESECSYREDESVRANFHWGKILLTGNISSQVAREDKFAALKHSSLASVSHGGGMDHKVLQAKKVAIAEAQQDHWLGSFRSFDSSFGNFIIPVIPTRADLLREGNIKMSRNMKD